MTLILLAFLGGVLTILSPCTLPVIPFVFARSDRPFHRGTLPLLFGMAGTFMVVGLLATWGGTIAIRVNESGRVVALVALALLGAALLSHRIAEWMARPAVALGNHLSRPTRGTGDAPTVLPSLLLGVATGLLWAPCAGPILGLILAGAAIRGSAVGTATLLLGYALGAATSLGIAAMAGRRVFALLRRSLGVGEVLRRVMGAAVLASVVVIALGWDTAILARWSSAGTERVETWLLASPLAGARAATRHREAEATRAARTDRATLDVQGPLPPLDGATAWINSGPLSAQSLRGRVVLVDFWTYSCINCLRTLPYLKAWYARYRDRGFLVLGIHAPEFAFEHDENAVRRAVRDLGIEYPVALDNRFALWTAFSNEYWPAHYLIDSRGSIRAHHFGEGAYAQTESEIRTLLEEASAAGLPERVGLRSGEGIEASADRNVRRSPETYLGYAKSARFDSIGGIVPEAVRSYSAPGSLEPDHWALAGTWKVEPESANLRKAPGRLEYRFRARDVHLVLGRDSPARPIRFRVTVDGVEPGADHGVDVDEHGVGTVDVERLYQLIRQQGGIRDRTLRIEFLDPGVRAFAFTFG